jgi:hypothetical protein
MNIYIYAFIHTYVYKYIYRHTYIYTYIYISTGKPENMYYNSLHSSLTVTSEDKQILSEKKALHEQNTLKALNSVNEYTGECYVLVFIFMLVLYFYR